jgi:hypothetical protein
MDAIIERVDLVSPKTFAELFNADVNTVMQLIKARDLDCESIMDGNTRRVYVNLDMFIKRSQAQGVTGGALIKRLARECGRL